MMEVQLPKVQTTKSTSLFNCCGSGEESQELISSAPPRNLKWLNFLQHPLPMFIEASAVGGSVTDFFLRLKMNGAGCDLSAMWKISSPALYVPIIIFSIAIPACMVGYYVHRSENNRLLVIQDVTSEAIVLSDGSHSIDVITDADSHDVDLDDDQAPSSQFLQNAWTYSSPILKDKLIQLVEAFIFGVLFDVLVWPTVADSYNCYTKDSTIGSMATKVVLPLVMLGMFVLYCIGAKIERAERRELMPDENSELGRRATIFDLSDEGSGIEFQKNGKRAHLIGDISRNEGNTKVTFPGAFYATLKGTRIFPEYVGKAVRMHSDGEISSYVLGDDEIRQLQVYPMVPLSLSSSHSSTGSSSTGSSSDDDDAVPLDDDDTQ